MKKLIIPVLAIMLLAPGCKFFKKKGWFSSKSDTLVAYTEKLESKLKAEALKHEQELAKLQEESEAEITALKEQCDEQNNKYHIIVGGFKVPANADKYTQVMSGKGYNAKVVIARNGFHLVSVNSFGDRKSAIGKLRTVIQEIEPKAWIYVR